MAKSVAVIKGKGLPSPKTGYFNPYIKKEIDNGFFESIDELKANLKDISWLMWGDLIKLGII